MIKTLTKVFLKIHKSDNEKSLYKYCLNICLSIEQSDVLVRVETEGHTDTSTVTFVTHAHRELITSL